MARSPTIQGLSSGVDMVPVAVRSAVIRPTGVLGVATATLVTAITLAAITLTIRGDEILTVLELSIVFALPASVVVARGHLGRVRWQLPTPGAFVLFLWLFGLMPTLFQWTEESVVAISFTSDAVVWSRIVACAWFVLFAVSLGPAPTTLRPTGGDTAEPSVVFSVLLIVWGVFAAFAAEAGRLSYYGSAEGPAVAGSVDSAVNVWYVTLTPLILPMATTVMVCESRRFKWLGVLGVVLGVAGLFVHSERRLAVVSIYLCLFVVQVHRSAIKWRWVLLALAVGWLTMGPLVILYRGLRGEVRSTEGPVQQAWQSLATYATDERARVAAFRDASDNVRTRLGSATVLFVTMDHALEYGPNLSPSPLEAVVRLVPTVVWPSKNDVADVLSVELQFCALPGIPSTDFGLSPIAEFVFQFGPWIAPLGGIVYGLAGRLVNATSKRAAQGGAVAIAWLGYVVALAYFDSGTAAFACIREPFFLAGVVGALLAVSKWRAIRSVPRSPLPDGG